MVHTVSSADADLPRDMRQMVSFGPSILIRLPALWSILWQSERDSRSDDRLSRPGFDFQPAADLTEALVHTGDPDAPLAFRGCFDAKHGWSRVRHASTRILDG